MLALGRLSSTSVCALAKLAAALPALATWMVHVQLLPRVVEPLTLSLLVAVRSGAVTMTVSLKLLLLSLLSRTLLFGSTEALPGLRGLLNVPRALGVAVKTRSKLPPAARATGPLAVAV